MLICLHLEINSLFYSVIYIAQCIPEYIIFLSGVICYYDNLLSTHTHIYTLTQTHTHTQTHTLTHTHTPTHIFLQWYWWHNSYHCWKWTKQHKFNSWMRLFAFHLILIPLINEWIYSPSSYEKIIRHTSLINFGLGTHLEEGKYWICVCSASFL